MKSLALIAASSADQTNSLSNVVTIVLCAIIVLGIAAMLFLKKSGFIDKQSNPTDMKGSNTQSTNTPIEDEKFYLREIRKYVRIIAIIMIVSVICSVAACLIALFSIL